MRPTRLLSILAIAGLLLALAACGGNNAGSSATSSNGSTATSGSGQSTEATPTAAESSGDGGGGGGSTTDLASLADQLVPPNSTQVVRTDAGNGLFIAYDSTDSLDSLKSFYENAIKNAGMTIVSTTTAADGAVYIFTRPSDSSFGGSVALGPGSNGGSSGVTITLGQG